MKQKISNWSNNDHVFSNLYQPYNYTEIRKTLKSSKQIITMGSGFNYTLPGALTVVSKSSIKYLNKNKNPETVLNVEHNPLNTVIEMLPNPPNEQKYEELNTESDESIESITDVV